MEITGTMRFAEAVTPQLPFSYNNLNTCVHKTILWSYQSTQAKCVSKGLHSLQQLAVKVNQQRESSSSDEVFFKLLFSEYVPFQLWSNMSKISFAVIWEIKLKSASVFDVMEWLMFDKIKPLVKIFSVRCQCDLNFKCFSACLKIFSK